MNRRLCRVKADMHIIIFLCKGILIIFTTTKLWFLFKSTFESYTKTCYNFYNMESAHKCLLHIDFQGGYSVMKRIKAACIYQTLHFMLK